MSNHVTPTRESFVFYRSFIESIGRCPDDVQLVLLRAVIDYGLDQAVPDFTGVPYQPFVEAIWAGIRPQLDANHKRFLNGCKGGCPTGTVKPSMIGNQHARKNPNQNETKTKPNVNDNENDNENVNGNVAGTGLDSEEIAKKKRVLQLPFTNPEFIDVWNELMTQPKWKGKTDRALQMSLNQLSKYPEEFAVLLIQNAIAGNYQAVVFNDTPAKFKQWDQMRVKPGNTPTTVITNINDIYKD